MGRSESCAALEMAEIGKRNAGGGGEEDTRFDFASFALVRVVFFQEEIIGIRGWILRDELNMEIRLDLNRRANVVN